jgi:hypothetical protein
MSDRSAYLAAALASMQQQPTPTTGAGVGMGLGAQALMQYALGRQHRDQQNTLNSLANDPMMSGAMADGSSIPQGMSGMQPGMQTVNPDGSIGNPQQQFGGLAMLGQKLKGLFGGN